MNTCQQTSHCLVQQDRQATYKGPLPGGEHQDGPHQHADLGQEEEAANHADLRCIVNTVIIIIMLQTPVLAERQPQHLAWGPWPHPHRELVIVAAGKKSQVNKVSYNGSL